MANLDCLSARAINIILGLFLMLMGLFLVAISVTILPVIGFFVAIPVVILSVRFFFAPQDKVCFLSPKSENKLRSALGRVGRYF